MTALQPSARPIAQRQTHAGLYSETSMPRLAGSVATTKLGGCGDVDRAAEGAAWTALRLMLRCSIAHLNREKSSEVHHLQSCLVLSASVRGV